MSNAQTIEVFGCPHCFIKPGVFGSPSLRRQNVLCALWILCFVVAGGWAHRAVAEESKRVLIVHSFGNVSPPSTTRSIAFETELTKRYGQKVDLDEVSLDHARYGGIDMEEALVDYLQKRQARWQPDLVVPIGAPACQFVEQYRGRLFPQTPVVYTGMGRSRLPDSVLTNAAYVGESINMPGLVEDIIQVAPDTTNIVCVIGASQIEQYWKVALQGDFAQFTNRVGFTWLNDLSFDQILERVQHLPPHSFILLSLLNRDATGVSHNSNEALKQIAEVANAPVNSVYEEQMGLGIVGGRLYRAASEGEESAQIAVRILKGEAPSNFPAIIIPPSGPQYDWRQLQRWDISEDRLPVGSIIKFGQPTIWEQHKKVIVGGVLLVIGQSALIAGLVVNLRRRRKAERSLRESEERMKLAASAAALGLWEWNLGNNEVWVDGNSAQRNAESKNDSESDFDRFLRIIHPEDRDGVVQALANAINGDGNYEQVLRQVLADGQVIWIAARGKVEFNAQRKPVKMRGVAMDITERKLAEDRARESERQFLLIANSAPVYIWTTGPDKMCTFVNVPWLKFRGRTFEQELGTGWSEGVHPEDLAHCLKVYNESCDARKPFTMEYRVQRHDGEYRWFTDRGVPRYNAQGQFLGYIGTCVDVTEKRATEAEVQRWQHELSHVSRLSTLWALAGSMAHELRQPLAAIVNSAEAGRRFLDGGSRNELEVREALNDILEQGQRAGAVITEMRSMLKRDPGQMDPQDMNSIVRTVIEMVRSDLVNRRVTPILRLDPLLPSVRGHGVQLRQALLNLVMNACDAMAERPATQRTLTIESRSLATGGEVELSVADTGPGFPEEMLRRPFEPFRTTKAKGLGLGLAICRTIITAHEGGLVVMNNGKTGATIKFTLPAERIQAK
jgi:PAS domain S-box-containing protein